MEASSVVKIAKYRLLAYRLLLRFFMGKKRRDHFVKKKEFPT